jgi:predicted nuclease with RNAse H fold
VSRSDGSPDRGVGEVYLGIDLAASEDRPSALCALYPGWRLEFCELRGDGEIVERVLRYSPRCVAIDAPLSLPSGRYGAHSRLCEREARRFGIRILPPTLGPMRRLAERGSSLASRLRRLGLRVVETFPSGAQRLLSIWPGGERSAEGVSRGLRRLGLRLPRGASLDMVDAATCSLVALLYEMGRCMELGDPSEGLLVLPARTTRLSARRHSSCRSMRRSRRSRPS